MCAHAFKDTNIQAVYKHICVGGRLRPTGQARIIVSQSSQKKVSVNDNVDK